jgi:hypothetical protein
LIRFVAGNYLPLFIAAIVPLVRKERWTIWHVQFIMACASAVMGSLDWGSSDNVYILFGALIIVLGTFGLAEIGPRVLQAAAVAAAFTPLTYAPQTVIVSRHSHEALADLKSAVQALPGTVYAPGIGQFAGPPLFSPGAHWVAVEDMARGPGHNTADEIKAFALLDPALHPTGKAYLLTARPLSAMTAPVSLLNSHYALAQDYGVRFIALTGLPKRYSHGFPRYLYEFRQ